MTAAVVILATSDNSTSTSTTSSPAPIAPGPTGSTRYSVEEGTRGAITATGTTSGGPEEGTRRRLAAAPTTKAPTERAGAMLPKGPAPAGPSSFRGRSAAVRLTSQRRPSHGQKPGVEQRRAVAAPRRRDLDRADPRALPRRQPAPRDAQPARGKDRPLSPPRPSATVATTPGPRATRCAAAIDPYRASPRRSATRNRASHTLRLAIAETLRHRIGDTRSARKASVVLRDSRYDPRTTFGRADLIDAHARIRLAMQACQALIWRSSQHPTRASGHLAEKKLSTMP